MKKLAGNDFKTVDYFGITLVVGDKLKYLVTTSNGVVVGSINKPELDPKLDWLYGLERYSNGGSVMKYKCIKDFWMSGETAEKGNKPEFYEGKIYNFMETSVVDCIKTRDNGHDHYMGMFDDDFIEHFVLVEEE